MSKRKNGAALAVASVEGDVIRPGDPGLPVVPVARVGQLNTIKAVSRELGRLYRAARQGKIDPAIAARLAYTLNILIGGIRAGSWEERLDRLEANANLPRLTEPDPDPIPEAQARIEHTDKRDQDAAADAAVIGAES